MDKRKLLSSLSRDKKRIQTNNSKRLQKVYSDKKMIKAIDKRIDSIRQGVTFI